MPAGQNTIWDTFLSPIARFLIDEDKWRRYAQSIDWEKESDVQGQAASHLRFRRNYVIIPSYYSSQNFHGIKGGYLNSSAAGFGAVCTEDVLWIHQLTSGVKPISVKDDTVQVNQRQYTPAIDNNNQEGLESPALA